MCLIIKEKQKVKTAKKDIVCYKFLEEYNGKGVITPYKKSSVVIGETYTSELWRYKTSVEMGLHTFTTEDVAIKVASRWIRFSCDCLVVECIIPKGSKYYVGCFDGVGEWTSFASDTLRYVKTIHRFKKEFKSYGIII